MLTARSPGRVAASVQIAGAAQDWHPILEQLISNDKALQLLLCNNSGAASENLLKCNSCGHRNKGEKASYLWKASGTQRSPVRHPCLPPFQPLNEGWEGVDPGSTPSDHSGSLHAPEHPWVGPAFPPGAPSLLQAVTQHFCCSTLTSKSIRKQHQ